MLHTQTHRVGGFFVILHVACILILLNFHIPYVYAHAYDFPSLFSKAAPCLLPPTGNFKHPNSGRVHPTQPPPPPWPMVHFGISAISGFHLAIACVENTIAQSVKLRVVHHHQADTPSTLTSGAAPYRIFFFFSMLRFSETSNVHSRRKKPKSKLLKVAYWTASPGGYFQHPTKKTLHQSP